MDLRCTLFQLVIILLACGQSTCLPSGRQQILSPDAPGFPNREESFVLPVFDINWAERYEEIHVNREGYLYGPPLLGNTSFFPTGVLGEAMVQRDKQLWFRDVAYVTENVNKKELPYAAKALAMVSAFALTLGHELTCLGWRTERPFELQRDI